MKNGHLFEVVCLCLICALILQHSGSSGAKVKNINNGDASNTRSALPNGKQDTRSPSSVIEELKGEELLLMIQESPYLAVYFWNKTHCDLCPSFNNEEIIIAFSKPEDEEANLGSRKDDLEEVDVAAGEDNCDQCSTIMEKLENIDDECDQYNISFVKSQDFDVAEEYGITNFPALVYFELEVANFYEGDLRNEDNLLEWLIMQRTEDRIELITRDMLEDMVMEVEYLAVYFFKGSCLTCDLILEELEHMDDDCDVYGIQIVKINDNKLARRYGIKTFPALIYFRNGNPLVFEGDITQEFEVLAWLTSSKTREIVDEIEEVNMKMLDLIISSSPLLAVLFYKEDNCPNCVKVLNEIENIDDEADLYGIDMVKISEPAAHRYYNITKLPTLIYFKKREPIIYKGNLLNEGELMDWMTNQNVFMLKNEIDEVNSYMMMKLIEQNQFLAVFFYDVRNKEWAEVLNVLEKIDDDTEAMNLTIVKLGDPVEAQKWGVIKLPAIVFFRDHYPSIYRGDVKNDTRVLSWLRENLNRQSSVNFAAYFILTALTIIFTLHTVYGMQPIYAVGLFLFKMLVNIGLMEEKLPEIKTPALEKAKGDKENSSNNHMEEEKLNK